MSNEEQRLLGERLLEQALIVQARAYAPYSRFAVGAALLDEQERIHLGVNVENVSYPVGWCAEASALAAMITAGGKKVKAIAVVGSGKEACWPCGACRQRLLEFSSQEGLLIWAASRGGRICEFSTLDALLPHSFGPSQLS